MRSDEMIIEALEVLGIASTTEISDYWSRKGKTYPNFKFGRVLYVMERYKMVCCLGEIHKQGNSTLRWRLTS